MPEPGARLFLALVPADAPGHPVLASVASPSFFLIGELLLGNLSETVVVVGNAPHDRPSFLVCHLIGNRASFLCTSQKRTFCKASHQLVGAKFRRSSAVATSIDFAAQLRQSLFFKQTQ